MSEYKTTNSTTIYEISRAISFRAKQLKYGAPPSPEYQGDFDPIKIAKFEIRNRLIPICFVRSIPDINKNGFVPEELDIRQMNIRDF